MEQTISRKNLSWTYGILLGVANIVISVISFLTMDNYMENGWLKSLIGFAIFIALVLYPMHVYAKNHVAPVSFGELLKLGMGVTAVSLIIGVIYLVIFSNFIDPNMKEMMLQKAQADMEAKNLPADQMQAGLEMTKKFLPLFLYGGVIVVTLFSGLIISLIGAAIFKKER